MDLSIIIDAIIYDLIVIDVVPLSLIAVFSEKWWIRTISRVAFLHVFLCLLLILLLLLVLLLSVGILESQVLMATW